MHSRLIFQGFSLFQFSQLPNKNKFLTVGWGLGIWGWNNLKSSCVSVASTRPLNLRPPPPPWYFNQTSVLQSSVLQQVGLV